MKCRLWLLLPASEAGTWGWLSMIAPSSALWRLLLHGKELVPEKAFVFRLTGFSLLAFAQTKKRFCKNAKPFFISLRLSLLSYSIFSLLQIVHQPSDCKLVPGRAKPSDLPYYNRSDKAFMTKFLTTVDIGQMDFNSRNCNG